MIVLTAAGVVVGAVGGFVLFEVYPTVLDGQGPLAQELADIRAFAVKTMNDNGFGSCRIKGNISVERGERIYHVPGGEYYSRTRIDTSRGEHWFCTEAEARAAGWRKSRR
jgi:hypothetical protein